MKKLGMLRAACCAGLLGAVFVARGDTIWLTNGRSLTDIVVLEEGAEKVIFKQGSGKMSLPIKSVQKIERDSEKLNALRMDAWQTKYFYTEEYAPSEFSELVAEFQHLKKVRESAMMAKRRMEISASSGQSAQFKVERLEREVEALREQLSEISSVAEKKISQCNNLSREINALGLRIDSLDLDSDEREYLIKKHKQLRKKWQSLSRISDQYAARRASVVKQINDGLSATQRARQEIETGKTEKSKIHARMLPYVNAIESMLANFTECATPENREQHPEFFKGMESMLTGMLDDLKIDMVPVLRNGDQLLVKALLNGEIEATLLLDTGATSTTLSKALATRLGIKEESKGVSILADGSRVTTSRVTLDSVKVGSAVREKVAASVFDEPPGIGVDGLLGMSFLKHFKVQLDTENNQVELIHLDD